MPRMRLIAEAYNELHTSDPNTALTLCGLRRLVNENIIPHIRVGRKIIINYDFLLEFLSIPHPAMEEANVVGQIRRVI